MKIWCIWCQHKEGAPLKFKGKDTYYCNRCGFIKGSNIITQDLQTYFFYHNGKIEKLEEDYNLHYG